MIDEIQDLPHAVLLLLSRLSNLSFLFAGDTAQSIAKGVSFRFCDLNHVFDEKYFGKLDENLSMKKPILKQLTVINKFNSNINLI